MKQLELYVHIPFCVRKCAYCDFLSFASDEKTQLEYAESLIKEICFWAPAMQEYAVSTIFIGGGTPSWLDEDKMVEILDAIYRNFHVLADAEVSMECNPGTVTLAKLKKYRSAGVNRLSIGLQSADNEELKLLGRIHTFEQFLRTYEMARSAGFANINVDLISGIPYQTAEKFLCSLKRVVQLRPNHISAYSLIVEPETPFYEAYQKDLEKQEAGQQPESLPTEEEVYRIIKLTQQFLKEAGYEQYEISNFAHPGFACRHNIGYWTRENYLGLGLGAASLIENVRYSNVTDLWEYIRQTQMLQWKSFQTEEFMQAIYADNLHTAVDCLSRKAQMEEFMFLGLRMKCGVERAAFQEKFGIPIEGIYYKPLEQLKADGFLEIKEGNIRLTERGEELSNYVLAQFLLD